MILIHHPQLAKDGFAKFTSYHFLQGKKGRKEGRKKNTPQTQRKPPSKPTSIFFLFSQGEGAKSLTFTPTCDFTNSV